MARKAEEALRNLENAISTHMDAGNIKFGSEVVENLIRQRVAEARDALTFPIISIVDRSEYVGGPTTAGVTQDLVGEGPGAFTSL